MSDQNRPCRGDLPVVVLAAFARIALWTVLMLALWCLLPAAFGWAVTTVASDSMAPRIRAGDVVAAAPIAPDDVEPGHVLLVDDPDHDDRLRLHRLERIEADGLRLRGDANAAADSSLVAAEAVHGVGVLRVPWVGAPGLWLGTGEMAPLLGVVLAAGLAIALTRLDRPVRRGEPCRRCGSPRWQAGEHTVDDSETTDPSSIIRGVAAVGLIAVALTSTPTPSDAALSARTDTAAAAATDLFPGCFASPRLDSPVLAWDFGEPRGTSVRDLAGRGHVGTMMSSPYRNDGPCPGNPSMHFGPTDGRVQSGIVGPAPSTFSIEIWFRTDQASGRLIGFSSETSPASANKDRHLYIDADGMLRFGVQSPTWRFATTAKTRVTDGAWHHAVGTFRPGSMALYLDGELLHSRDDASTLKAYNGSWRVGRESLDGWPNQPTSFRFAGDLDTARVYDTALDAAAVREHFAAGR